MAPVASSTLRYLCGAFLVGVFCAGALAAAPAPATDGLVWEKGYPKTLAPVSGKTPMTVAGKLDTTKYKDIKITSNVAYWEAVQIDKDGKEIEGTKHKFKLNLYKDRNPQAWDGSSTKEIVNGVEMNFAGFLPGTYKVTVEMNVKETPTSTERAAIITTTVIIADPVPEPGLEESPPPPPSE